MIRAALWRLHYAGSATTTFAGPEARTSTSERCHLHRIFEWNVPKVQDFLGFCAVSVYFHWLIHRFIDGIYRRVIKVALGSITRASTRHPMATLAQIGRE